MKNKYKNPRFWLLLTGILAVLAAGVWLLVWLLTPKGDDLLTRVLDSRAAFVDEAGQSVRLSEYTPVSDGEAVAPERHTMLDLDGDGQQELVVYYPQGSGTYLVFHIYEDRVYGFAFPEGEFQNLKADGTFLDAKNAHTVYWYRLAFRETGYERRELAYFNPGDATARLDGKEASQGEAVLYGIEAWSRASANWVLHPALGDPVALYVPFLEGKTTALDNWTPKKLAAYIPSDGVYSYAYYDMTGDGRPELCVSSDHGISIFTVRNGALCHWYTGESYGTRLMENGMLLDANYEYDLSGMYYTYRALTEQGQNMFLLYFSWTDVKYTYQDHFYFNDREVTQEEYEEKTGPYRALKEMPWKTGVEAAPPPSYDELLLKVLHGEKKFLDETGRSVYFKDHNATAGELLPIRAIRYALVDMDGDGTNEMVIFSLPSGTFGCYTVLWVSNGQVYGYDFPHTGLQSLKADGSYTETDSNGNISYLTLTFEGTGYQTHELAYCNAAYETPRVYRIGGKYATLEQITAYRHAFTLKPEANWQTVPPVAEDSTYAKYEAFLAGEIKAIDSSGTELSFGKYLAADAGNFTYALMDMTGDGVPELLTKMTYSLHIFTVKDGRVRHWHTADARRYTLLNNGAFLYERLGTAPTHVDYEYLELDETGSVKRKITFSHYDAWENIVPVPDVFLINGQEVTREEYEKQVLPYLQIGSDKIVWYPTAAQNLDLLKRMLESKMPFTVSTGESYLLRDYKLDGAAVEPQKYALVDMDGDEADELVVATESKSGTYFVFKVYHGLIYGFEFGQRELIDLKTDGTFMSSEGAGISTWYRLVFAPNGFKGCSRGYFDLAYCNEPQQLYRLNGELATADQLAAFRAEFAARENVTWLDKI